MSGMTRSVERSTVDMRWRTEVHLDTGAVLTEHTEWEPAHWDSHADARLRALKDAERKAAVVGAKYGVRMVRILQFQESRRVLHVTERYESDSLHSEHIPTGADT